MIAGNQRSVNYRPTAPWQEWLPPDEIGSRESHKFKPTVKSGLSSLDGTAAPCLAEVIEDKPFLICSLSKKSGALTEEGPVILPSARVRWKHKPTQVVGRDHPHTLEAARTVNDRCLLDNRSKPRLPQSRK